MATGTGISSSKRVAEQPISGKWSPEEPSKAIRALFDAPPAFSSGVPARQPLGSLLGRASFESPREPASPFNPRAILAATMRLSTEDDWCPVSSGDSIKPPAMSRVRPSEKAVAFSKRVDDFQSIIESKLQEVPFTPLDLNGWGLNVTILSIQKHQPKKGEHSSVYFCEAIRDGQKEQLVLKTLKKGAEFRLDNAACQLMNYAKLKKDSTMSGLVIDYYSLDPHLGKTGQIVNAPRALREYAAGNLPPFVLAKRVPGEFPTRFDRTAGCWEQVRAMFEYEKKEKHFIDVEYSNVMVDEKGHAWLVDVCEINEDDPFTSWKRRRESFFAPLRGTSYQQALPDLHWLCPRLEDDKSVISPNKT